MMGGKIEILDKEGPGTLIRFDLIFEAPRKSNSTWSSVSFRMSPECLLPEAEVRQLATAGKEGGQLATAGKEGGQLATAGKEGGQLATAGGGAETAEEQPGGSKGGFFGALSRAGRRSRSPGDEAWLGADESGLGSNPPSPRGRGRSRQRSFDIEQGQKGSSPKGVGGVRRSEGDKDRAPQLAPIISGLAGSSEEIAQEPVSKVRRTVVLGMPGVLGRGLAKAWLEQQHFSVVECENWTSTMRLMESSLNEEPLKGPTTGAGAQAAPGSLEGPKSAERLEELLVIFDIDLLKSSEHSPAGQSPRAKLASLKNLLYQNQKARVNWAANREFDKRERPGLKDRAQPTRVAVGWLIETTTPSAMRHFLFKSGFPIKVGKPLYPTRLQKLMKMLTDAVNEPPSTDVTPPGEFPAALPPLEIRAPGDSMHPFYRPGGAIQGRSLPPEVQADLAKHQLSGGLSWNFFDNRGARAPIPPRPSSYPESEPPSWSTSPSGTTISSGVKDIGGSGSVSPSGGLEPGGFVPPERTISLSIDIPEFSPPATPLHRDSDASPDSNFAFHSEGAPSPLSTTSLFPSASDLLYPHPETLVGRLNTSASFASSSSYDTLLRTQSSSASQSSTEEFARGFKGLGRSGSAETQPAGLERAYQELPTSEREAGLSSRSNTPSPQVSPTTPIVTSSFSTSIVTALRSSTLVSSLSPPKEGQSTGGSSPASSDELGGSPNLLNRRTTSEPLGSIKEQAATVVHRYVCLTLCGVVRAVDNLFKRRWCPYRGSTILRLL
jgi:hypothetical protein